MERRERIAQQFEMAYVPLKLFCNFSLEYTRAHQGDCKFAVR